MKNKKAFTLTEVVITLFVLSIMMTMLVAVVILIKNNFNAAERRSSLQQNASVALAKLTRELMETSPDTITIYNPSSPSSPDPKGIIFASAREPSLNNKFDLDPNTAECVWHKYVCYYLDTDPENPGSLALFRKEKEITETTEDNPSPKSTKNFKDDTTLHTVIVAHRVVDLSFHPDIGFGSIPPSTIKGHLPLETTLILAEKNSTGQFLNSVSITFRVNMHN